MDPRLILQDVAKTYPDGTRALDGVSFAVGNGVFGLLGPNGAGKSTLMNVVATVTRAGSGRVSWDGADVARRPEAVRRVLGYLPQDFQAPPELSPREYLRYVGTLKGLSGKALGGRIESLLDLVGLGASARARIGGFSGGMVQRVGIAQALLGNPALLIVDEPTVGLDPAERVRFRNLLADLAPERVVLLSTHIVPDVEAAATRLAVIAGGRVRAEGSPEEILSRARGAVWKVTLPSAEASALRARAAASQVVQHAEGVEMRLVAGERPHPGAAVVEPTLEDAYLHLVGRESAPAGAA